MRYEIKRGDTLGGIAQRFGTTVQKLAAKNRIKNVNRINTGNSIILPDIQGSSMEAQVIKAKEKQPLTRVKDQLVDARQQAKIMRSQEDLGRQPKEKGVNFSLFPQAQATSRKTTSYKVKKGDTFNAIAKRNNMTPNQLAELNKGIKNRGKISVGQQINLQPQQKESSFSSLFGSKPNRASKQKEINPFEDTTQEERTAPFNLDPIKILSQQALLSLSERAAKSGLPLAMLAQEALRQDITEKDLSKEVVKAMRNNSIKMFETGASSMDDKLLGVGKRSDVTGGSLSKITEFFTNPNKSQSLITGETTRGGITLDENNNMILNDYYDFPDYDESMADTPYRKVHNLFEPRGTTGKEGIMSGLFAVSPKNTRNMRINLGKAPAHIRDMIRRDDQMMVAAR